jgi:hypothetical protein
VPEFNITAVCVVSDPEELQRRWGQVCRLLMELPRGNSGAEQEEPADATQPSVDVIPVATGR